MRPSVFFTYLVLMLLGGKLFAGFNFQSSSHFSGKPGQLTFTIANQDQALFASIDAPEQEKYLNCEVLEDEDGNDVSAKKFKSATGLHSVPAYCSSLNYQHNCAKALPFFWHQPSYRYILQRSLRI